MPGICARCRSRDDCRFRQPGTWVEECDLFEDRDATATTDAKRPVKGRAPHRQVEPAGGTEAAHGPGSGLKPTGTP